MQLKTIHFKAVIALVSILCCSFSVPLTADVPNLLPNADFENPAGEGMPTGWSIYQYGPEGSKIDVRRETGAGRAGSSAIRAQNIDPKSKAGIYTHVPLQPGTYQLSVWARAAKGKTALVKIYLASAYSPQVQIGDEWQKIAFTNTLPTLATPLDRSEINFQNCSTEPGIVWFDDISLEKIPSSAQLPDNQFTAITGKKLIEYGWDVPTPDYLRDHIQEMEQRPFEGVMFRLPNGGGKVFDVENWEKNSAALQDQLKVAREIKWNRFTDNFVSLYAASTMDWHSDSDWKKVLSAVTFNAKVAKAAGCVGLLFDPEPYGTNPWNYPRQKNADKYSYAQFSAKVYQRGQQFMQALQREIPAVKVIMFHQYQMLYAVANSPDPAQRQATLASAEYGLYLPFLNGMLSVINDDAQMIDGNENSYYYQKPTQFYEAYWQMREGAKINVPRELWRKYERNEKSANALYVDHLFSMRSGTFGYRIGAGMSPEDRARWFEQNTYYALKTTQEYVWLYSEKMNWWTGQGVPSGLENAVLSAKEKLMTGRGLGYNLEDTFKTAQDNLNKLLQDKLLKRRTTVPRLNPEQAPHIDGKLEETVYKELAWTEPFVSYLREGKPNPVHADTRAFFAYDRNNLYIAFRCEEPNMAAQQVALGGRDSGVWSGESVEFSLLQPGQPTDSAEAVFYHFILNPANVQWDALNTGTSSDIGYNPQWQSGVSKNANGWAAEIAIPWNELGVKTVESGLQLQANVARQRISDKTEYSSWSQFVSGFQEPQNFGTLILQ